MPGWDRRPLGKCAVAVVLIGAHALIIELLSRGSNRLTLPAKLAEQRTLLYFFELPHLEPPKPARSVLEQSNPPPLSKAVADSAITVTPELEIRADVNWAEEAAREARDWAKRREAGDADRSFDGHPKGMGPLPEHSAPKRGDVYRFEGGETIEWVNDHCYYTNQAQPGQIGPGRFPVRVCKPAGGASGFQDFESWRKARDALPDPNDSL